MGQPKVAVVGSYNVGLVVKTERIPVWGETIMGSGFSEGPGGKGSNQAVAVSRLGGKAYIIGCVGEDYYGSEALAMLSGENVDISNVRRTTQAKTGVGFIVLNHEGENCIIVDAGANRELNRDDIDKSSSVIANSDITLFQLEICLETTEYAMALAKKLNKITILNPAPASSNIGFLLKHASIVTPNESELKILTGINPKEMLNERQCIEAAKTLIESGPQTVIVTRGEQGAILVENDRVLSVPAPKVTPVDTTGAGDSFSAALAVFLGEGKTIEEAVRMACYAGAYTVTGPEVIPSLPTREQLEGFIGAYKI